MEFGLFVQGYVPEARSKVDPEAEHKALIEETEYVIQADKSNFKYAWASEHHFLEEYSHLSANEVFLGYLAHATERIHLGSGIFNPLAPVNHPVKVAEKVAMLDHLSKGRFEFGTGRGAGEPRDPRLPSRHRGHERHQGDLGRDHRRVPQDVPPGGVRGVPGQALVAPAAEDLPQAVRQGPPGHVVRHRSPASYAMAAKKGLGVLGFSVQKVSDMAWVLDQYKTAIQEAKAIGAFVNDNVMVTSTAICAETHDKAVEIAVNANMNRFQSLVFRYHDTFPRPEIIPEWPEILPEYNAEIVELLIAEELLICGDPSEVRAQCKRWEEAGADQLSFGLPTGVSYEDTMTTIKLIGEHVIPHIDTDPVHRTTRFREASGA